jgi:hypothetical protein
MTQLQYHITSLYVGDTVSWKYWKEYLHIALLCNIWLPAPIPSKDNMNFWEGFNPLKPSGNYMYHLLQQSETSFWIYRVRMILAINSINQLNFVMVKCRVFFAERTELLNII